MTTTADGSATTEQAVRATKTGFPGCAIGTEFQVRQSSTRSSMPSSIGPACRPASVQHPQERVGVWRQKPPSDADFRHAVQHASSMGQHRGAQRDAYPL